MAHLENGNIRYIPLQQSKYSDESDEESTAIPLRTKQELPTINVEVDADDTLQAISLKFHCTIAELKRVNNILRDNEIYARRTIRVPIRPNSILTEQIVGVHISGNSSPITTKCENISLLDLDTEAIEEKLKSSTINCNNKTSTNNNATSSTNSTSDLITINHLLNNTKVNEVQASLEQQLQQHQDNNTFFKNTDDNNVIVVDALKNKSLVHTLLSSGDDCGMSWLALVVLVILLGFVCPLIYILYIAEHPEKYHHH
ncbi:lysM and putative peptidoglycan-binding domain-containing protein 3 isoform X2 [Chrysoperla carnea]|uniref:lysM and putative peptidoglycan-binding domain-containing protein 3 isoform X2 n=1 Tax=Chrysoperla carnea TaxID=189513 RepID=UPI001D062E41|nr:lysM and putative peptidoglycan-binding domain-containing protein 3 isoform X2 [Chrysoperla carnea]